MVCLKNYGLLPYERTSQLFDDLFGVALSAGTLVNIDREARQRLVEVNERIKEGIVDSAVVHFNEIGMRLDGKLHWLHVAGTDTLTYYMPHGKQGSKAMDSIGILPRYQGAAIHDGWISYFNYPCKHVLCNVHHLRELTFVYEQGGQSWDKQLKEFLLEVKAKGEESTAKRFTRKTILAFFQVWFLSQSFWRPVDNCLF